MDAALRLGGRPVALAILGGGPWSRAWLRMRLADRPLPAVCALPADGCDVPPALGFDPAAPAAGLDAMAGPDIRPVWEANRWAELPLFALAGEAERIAPWLGGWFRRNPPFRGPNWGCGQEAALRALHLALASALAGNSPPRDIMALLARRIGANPAYAMAQDNNHPISEAAGLLACGLALGDAGLARRGARRLDRAVARLVAPDGSFAQPSPAYHRLLLDVVGVTEWLRRRGGGPPPAERTSLRMAAATRWLHRLACPETGALPRIGHQDGSHFADISGAGAEDARPSIERAARIFCDTTAGWPEDPGCAALGLAAPAARLAADRAWRSLGFLGRAGGPLRAVLRTGPLRFRPGHADLLHLDVWNGPLNLLRDAGTGAYNPVDPGWVAYFQGTAAHNTIAFDDEDQMPRAGPFLFAHWPATGELPDGAWLRDHRGRVHERRIIPNRAGFTVEDRTRGAFSRAVARWHLAPGEWTLTAEGVTGPAGGLRVRGSAPIALRLASALESPAYGVAVPHPVLEVSWGPGEAWLLTDIRAETHA